MLISHSAASAQGNKAKIANALNMILIVFGVLFEFVLHCLVLNEHFGESAGEGKFSYIFSFLLWALHLAVHINRGVDPER